MKEIVFRSILKDEIVLFLKVLKLSISTSDTYNAYQRTLSDFDSFLHEEKLTVKKLDDSQIKRWIDAFNVRPSTKKGKLTHIRRFAGYLSSLGIETKLPEMPRIIHDFTPYVFTADEMTRIFEAADDLVLSYPNSRRAAEFPLLLRMLYGCGFRLGEVIALTWDEIDLSNGVVTVKVAKNQKQRLVPMSDELTRILKLYKATPYFNMQNCNLIFKTNDGRPCSATTYWIVFNRILCELGIKTSQKAKHRSHGPCIHSLRHTFAMQSLLKAEAEGNGFMDTVPFLSTYLGHSGLMETDKYLQARHELYTQAHAIIEDYTRNVFPKEV